MLPYHLLLPLGLFYFTNAIIGIIGNGVMIMCYFKNPKFHSSCHFFITLTCLSDLLHLAGELVNSTEIFAKLTTTQYTCYYMMIIPIAGAAAGSPLILVIGIDRLIAVMFPTRYREVQLDKKKYILIQLIFPISYTISVVVLGYQYRVIRDDFEVQCPLPIALIGFPFKFLTYISAIIYLLVIITYSTVYILLKTKPASVRFKSVFNSILITVIVVLIGCAATSLINIINNRLITDELLHELILVYSGIPVNIGVASNVFVFYSINLEYRKTIDSIFGFLRPDITTVSVSSRKGKGLIS